MELDIRFMTHWIKARNWACAKLAFFAYLRRAKRRLSKEPVSQPELQEEQRKSKLLLYTRHFRELPHSESGSAFHAKEVLADKVRMFILTMDAWRAKNEDLTLGGRIVDAMCMTGAGVLEKRAQNRLKNLLEACKVAHHFHGEIPPYPVTLLILAPSELKRLCVALADAKRLRLRSQPQPQGSAVLVRLKHIFH